MVASAYAVKLGAHRLHKEAAVMYRRAGDFYNAMLSHQKALDWRNCLQDAAAAEIRFVQLIIIEKKKLLYFLFCFEVIFLFYLF